MEGQPWEGAEAEFYLWYYPDLQNTRIPSQETLPDGIWVSKCEKALEHRPANARDPNGLELILNTAASSALQISNLAFDSGDGWSALGLRAAAWLARRRMTIGRPLVVIRPSGGVQSGRRDGASGLKSSPPNEVLSPLAGGARSCHATRAVAQSAADRPPSAISTAKYLPT